MRSAASYLPIARARVLDEVRSAADEVAHLLANAVRTPEDRSTVRDATGRIQSNDGAGNGSGEWDWFWSLATSERSRLKRWMSVAITAPGPAEYAETVREVIATDDVEDAMREWARATALRDAVRSLERGRVPSVHVDAITSYDPCELFGADAASYLATALRDERERFGTREVAEPAFELVEAF